MNESHKNEKLAYTIPEVAELTSLSVSYLYRLSAEGRLPVSRVGKRCLIIPEDLNNWLREHSRLNVIISQKRKLGG